MERRWTVRQIFIRIKQKRPTAVKERYRLHNRNGENICFFLHFYCVIFIVLLQPYSALYANIDLHLTVRPSSFISSINLCTAALPQYLLSSSSSATATSSISTSQWLQQPAVAQRSVNAQSMTEASLCCRSLSVRRRSVRLTYLLTRSRRAWRHCDAAVFVDRWLVDYWRLLLLGTIDY